MYCRSKSVAETAGGGATDQPGRAAGTCPAANAPLPAILTPLICRLIYIYIYTHTEGVCGVRSVIGIDKWWLIPVDIGVVLNFINHALNAFFVRLNTFGKSIVQVSIVPSVTEMENVRNGRGDRLSSRVTKLACNHRTQLPLPYTSKELYLYSKVDS